MMTSFFNNGDLLHRCEALAQKHAKSEELKRFKLSLGKLTSSKLVIFHNKVFDLVSTEVAKIAKINPRIKMDFRCQTLNDAYDFGGEEYVVGILISSLKDSSTKNIKHHSRYLYQRIEPVDYCFDKSSEISKSFFDYNEFVSCGKIRLLCFLDELREKILDLHGQEYYLLQAKFIKLCQKYLRVQLDCEQLGFKQWLKKKTL